MTDIITAAQNPEQGDVGENLKGKENGAHKSPAATQGPPASPKVTERLRNNNDFHLPPTSWALTPCRSTRRHAGLILRHEEAAK